jgi:phage terminase large subunit-like protein
MTTLDLDPRSMSFFERLSLLDDRERESILGDLSVDDLFDPELWLRPDQLDVLHDPAPTVLLMAGRGSGKTRVGGGWAIEKARYCEGGGSIGHLVGRTVSDVRDVMVQGESGILALSPPSFMPDYKPSLRRLEWPNGSHALTFSSEEPQQLRGPQAHWTWVDEMAALNHRPDSAGVTAWEHVQIGTRLGAYPQILATTTPKRIAAIRELVRAARTTARVALHGASTMANRAHLSPDYLRTLYLMYAGTALERQELHGELLDIVEAALWQPDDIVLADAPWIETYFADEMMSVIGVDPGLTTGGDATGIITVRSTTELTLTSRKVLIVADDTEGGLQPERWAARVVEAWRRERDLTGRVPIIVAEKNAGGEMVASVMEAQAGANELPIALITAKGSKAARAEPIVMAYRSKHRVRHLEVFAELVEEQTGWEPPVPGRHSGSGWSPNRLDALVIAARSCVVDDKDLRRFGKLGAPEPRGPDGEVLTVPESIWRRNQPGRLDLPWRSRSDPTDPW